MQFFPSRETRADLSVSSFRRNRSESPRALSARFASRGSESLPLVLECTGTRRAKCTERKQPARRFLGALPESIKKKRKKEMKREKILTFFLRFSPPPPSRPQFSAFDPRNVRVSASGGVSMQQHETLVS